MMPNFLVIGAARSGTTSLHNYLGSHPEIYVSPLKEPNFFAHDGERFEFDVAPGWRTRARRSVSDPRQYEALFSGVRDEKAIGEVSPSYMRSPGAAERIRQTIPEARLVAILRDPSARAYANYMGRLREGTERDMDPYEALGVAPGEPGPRWRTAIYIEPGCYYQSLRPYFDRFSRDRMRIVLFEDFVRDPRVVLREIFSFLEVDPEFVPDTSVAYNATGKIGNPLLRFAWVKSRRLRSHIGPRLPLSVRRAAMALLQRNLSRPPLPPELRAVLIERYRTDISQLEELIDRDLSRWRV